MKFASAVLFIFALLGGSASLLNGGLASTRAAAVIPLPADYQSWRHVKTQVIQEGPGFARFGGMHHIYANDRALQGLRTRRFEDGAVFVAEFRELVRKDNVIDAGTIRIVDVMLFDTRRFADTGGWGYAEFEGPSLAPRSFDAVKECHTCHTQRADKGFVFSEPPRS